MWEDGFVVVYIQDLEPKVKFTTYFSINFRLIM